MISARTLRLAAAALPLALALAGCPSPEEKLVDRRRELRDALDALYVAYQASAGRGEGAASEASAEGEASPDGGGIVARFLGEIGRGVFEQHCLAVGRGERPFAMSERLERFASERANARACRRAADLQREVDELQREIEARRGGS